MTRVWSVAWRVLLLFAFVALGRVVEVFLPTQTFTIGMVVGALIAGSCNQWNWK